MPERMTAEPVSTAQATELLHQIKGFVFDMDGTLVLGDRSNRGLKPLPGAVELTRLLRERGVPFVVCTNGTTRVPAQYAAVLRGLGFPVDDDSVLTPASSAVDVFQQIGYRRVMVLGGDGLTVPLRDAGIDVVKPVRDSGAEAVLVGWFREVTFADLEAACDAVWAGARFYSSSQSMFFATAEGRTLGTSRAISAVVHDLTGAPVEVVGKPSSHALEAAAHRLGLDSSRLAVVGDDPELEMVMAHRGGALAVSVATGVHELPGFDSLPVEQRPDLNLAGTDALLDLYRVAG